MENIRKYYGDTLVKLNGYNSKSYFNEFKVEYYKIIDITDDDKCSKFGIEVIKKIKIENGEIIEKKEIKNFLDEEEKADKLLFILKRNKVTPVCMEEVIEDLKWFWN